MSLLCGCVCGVPMLALAWIVWQRVPRLRTPMVWAGGLGTCAFASLLGFALHRFQLDGPVLDAAKQGDAKALEAALRAGGSPDAGAGDDAGLSALVTALNKGNATCVEVLLKHGADPNEESVAGKPLRMAEDRGRSDLVRLLKRYGAR